MQARRRQITTVPRNVWRHFLHAVLSVPRLVTFSGGALLGFGGIVMLWAGVFYFLAAERDQALRAAVQNTTNLSRAFEEHIIRSIKSVDLSLLHIRDAYRANPANFDVADWSRSLQSLTDLTFQIGLIDKNGILKLTNLGGSGNRVDLSDREHFKVHRDNPRDELFISKPVLGRVSQKWAIQMTRKVTGPDGMFDGVIVLSLDPGYLSGFYRSVDLGPNGVVTLSGIDGIVRARSTALAEGDQVGQSLVGSTLMAAFGKATEGHYITPSRLDGITRVFAYRGVRGYPLIVSVGIGEADVLASYRQNRLSYLLLASILTGLLLSVIVMVLVRQRRLDLANEALRTSEAAFAEKSELLRITLEHMSQGILMTDADHQIRVRNQWLIERPGLPGALTADTIGRNSGSEAPGSEAPGTEPWTDEHASPEGLITEIRGMPVPGGGMVLTYTDITARRENETQLRAARDDANRASQAKSEFLATMSHEIRSPMSGMLGVLELLRGTPLDAAQSQLAVMAQSAGTGLLAILNDILDFSKIEADALTIVPEPVSLRDVLRHITPSFGVSAKAKGVDLVVIIDPGLPDYIQTDPLRLRQILNNLLSNAVKFTASGEVRLEVDVTEGEPGPTLRLAISDTGIGMEESALNRLFQPFTQADGSTSRQFGGTGLGLSISRRLARLMGGDILVTSRLGQGTVFSVALPFIPASAPAPPDTDSLTPAGLISFNVEVRVLVTDDDPTNRFVAKRLLELMGLTADAAESGEEALRMLHARQYDLLLTDCHMPGMDGVALARAVRETADPALRDLPIIGLTADVTAAQRSRCEAAGMAEVTIKPLNHDRLTGLLVRHLAHLLVARGPDEPGSAIAAATESPISMTFDDQIWRSLFPPGDPEGTEWFADYQESADLQLQELKELLSGAADDSLRREEIAALAHKLAGSSFCVGAALLGDNARSLEQAAATGDRAALLVLLATLHTERAAVKREIETCVGQPRPEHMQPELAT